MEFGGGAPAKLAAELIEHFISENLKGGAKINELSEAWSKVRITLNEADSLNMDKKQVMYNIITTICGAL